MRIVLFLITACFFFGHNKAARRTFWVPDSKRPSLLSPHARISSKYPRQEFKPLQDDLIAVASLQNDVRVSENDKSRDKMIPLLHESGFLKGKSQYRVVRSAEQNPMRQAIIDYVDGPSRAGIKHEPVCVSHVIHTQIYHAPYSQKRRPKPHRPPTPGTALHKPFFNRQSVSSQNHWDMQQDHRPLGLNRPQHYPQMLYDYNQYTSGQNFLQHDYNYPGRRYMHQNWPNPHPYPGLTDIRIKQSKMMDHGLYKYPTANPVGTRQSFNLQNGILGSSLPTSNASQESSQNDESHNEKSDYQ